MEDRKEPENTLRELAHDELDFGSGGRAVVNNVILGPGLRLTEVLNNGAQSFATPFFA